MSVLLLVVLLAAATILLLAAAAAIAVRAAHVFAPRRPEHYTTLDELMDGPR